MRGAIHPLPQYALCVAELKVQGQLYIYFYIQNTSKPTGIQHRAMKTYDEVEAQLHAFLTSATS